jgi:hypothetical protein
MEWELTIVEEVIVVGAFSHPKRTLKETTMKRVLITGAGTGFGHEAAMRLSEKGFEVIAAVEIWAEVQTLKREAAARGSTLRSRSLT